MIWMALPQAVYSRNARQKNVPYKSVIPKFIIHVAFIASRIVSQGALFVVVSVDRASDWPPPSAHTITVHHRKLNTRSTPSQATTRGPLTHAIRSLTTSAMVSYGLLQDE